MKNTLKTIFQQKFDLEKYKKTILSDLLHAQRINVRPEFLETTSDGDNVYGLGILEDANRLRIGLFYTEIQSGDVTRKRVGLRRVVQPYIKAHVDAALAVFDDGKHWRLSFVTDLQGQNTNPKRFSYVFGDADGQYRTPVERLAALQTKSSGSKFDNITIEKIRDVFSVDALSDDFFKEYHRHYDKIVAAINTTQLHPAQIHDYVKKMMGRIVFLHFLQKKGWLCGDNNFMLNTFANSNIKNDYLESVLEPLFFGMLNTEPQKREQSFKINNWNLNLLQQWNPKSENSTNSQPSNPNSPKNNFQFSIFNYQFSGVPYLNGGLFERDDIDNMTIKLPSAIFEDLFNFLASYNFTIDENDPDDAEVGVDPEMLGKIFESLLEDNKAKGAFYTPKEIVRYMCKESLIAYLQQRVFPNENENPHIRQFVETHEFPEELNAHRDIIDQTLREVKICDPAIGSGAFPMGLLNELWRCREALGTELSRLQLKKEIIENNIYGVDIEKGAIDIARLRFWLSIVVDSDFPEPLPNFDYKFMQGNSLLECFGGVDLSGIMSDGGRISRLGKGRQKAGENQYGFEFAGEEAKSDLQQMLREYFSLTDHTEKTALREAINCSVKHYIESEDLTPADLARLSAIDPSANQHFFLWHTWFKDIFDQGGFDIVIGNPPYINVEKISPIIKANIKLFETAYQKFDLYVLFFELGINILKKNGILVYITSNKFLSQGYGLKLRQLLLTKEIMSIVNFNYDVFLSATVRTSILLLKNYLPKSDNLIKLIDITQKADKYKFEKLIYNTIEQSVFSKTEENNFRLSLTTEKMGIIEKIQHNCLNVYEICSVNYGLRPSSEILGLKKDAFIFSSNENGKYQKYFEGKDMGYWLVENYNYINYQPEVMYNAMFPELFSNEKLVGIRTLSDINKLRFIYDNQGMYCNDSVVVLTLWHLLKDVKYKTIIRTITTQYIENSKKFSYSYLQGILNSKLIKFYFNELNYDGTHFYPNHMKQLPIKEATPTQQEPIIRLVDNILAAKKQNPHADTTAEEAEIDKLVYQLYNLTDDDIRLIEQG